MPRATTTERSRAMKRTRNGILIPDVPIMAGGNLPNAVKGVSAGGGGGFDPSRTPFYIDVRGTVTLAATSGLQTSTDGKTWTDTVAGDLPTGRTYFRVASDQTSPLKPNWTEKDDSDYDIGGNINSLTKVNFENDITCYNFYLCFENKAKLKRSGNLILPATTLVKWCYQNMFKGCKSLTTAPALPARTLADGCYNGMFQNCTSLTTAPELPVMTLAPSCYSNMFNGCELLTTAPELPATTMVQSCYQYMFANCKSLITAPELPATTLAQSCYQYMFNSCKSLITAPELPVMTLAPSCYHGMFNNCSSLITAPALPATTLAENCYQYMFAFCTLLTTAPELPARILTTGCYSSIFYNSANINYIKCLATNKSASNCTKDWVKGVASTGTFVKHKDMAGWGAGNNGIPYGWTVEESD